MQSRLKRDTSVLKFSLFSMFMLAQAQVQSRCGVIQIERLMLFVSRRGSNVSLVLDMSALGSVEPLSVAIVSPRESAAREYLLSAGRPLTKQQLRDVVNNTHKLHAEFAVSM